MCMSVGVMPLGCHQWGRAVHISHKDTDMTTCAKDTPEQCFDIKHMQTHLQSHTHTRTLTHTHIKGMTHSSINITKRIISTNIYPHVHKHTHEQKSYAAQPLRSSNHHTDPVTAPHHTHTQSNAHMHKLLFSPRGRDVL